MCFHCGAICLKSHTFLAWLPEAKNTSLKWGGVNGTGIDVWLSHLLFSLPTPYQPRRARVQAPVPICIQCSTFTLLPLVFLPLTLTPLHPPQETLARLTWLSCSVFFRFPILHNMFTIHYCVSLWKVAWKVVTAWKVAYSSFQHITGICTCLQ